MANNILDYRIIDQDGNRVNPKTFPSWQEAKQRGSKGSYIEGIEVEVISEKWLNITAEIKI